MRSYTCGFLSLINAMLDDLTCSARLFKLRCLYWGRTTHRSRSLSGQWQCSFSWRDATLAIASLEGSQVGRRGGRVYNFARVRLTGDLPVRMVAMFADPTCAHAPCPGKFRRREVEYGHDSFVNQAISRSGLHHSRFRQCNFIDSLFR